VFVSCENIISNVCVNCIVGIFQDKKSVSHKIGRYIYNFTLTFIICGSHICETAWIGEPNNTLNAMMLLQCLSLQKQD